MRVLVVNAGSSSLKLRLLDHEDRVAASTDLPSMRTRQAEESLERFVRDASTAEAVGHRLVHGGPDFRKSVVVTDEVMERLRATSELAPLHNPPALAALEAVRRLLRGVPEVACFDTAFHSTLPVAAALYAVPREWTERWGIRRFGFHGFSHAYATRRTADLLGQPVEELRVVTCHLGAGASLAAVAFGRSVDTTMGFTPLEGLVMATRSGSVDPGALLWLQRRAAISPEEMERALEKESGVLALAGSSDMRDVIQRSHEGDRPANLALEVYVHRLRAGVAAMAAAMNGLDALVFTGGVGENAPVVRQRAADGLNFLGIQVDPRRNSAGSGDREIGAKGATVRTLVVVAREDLQIAREVRRLLAS